VHSVGVYGIKGHMFRGNIQGFGHQLLLVEPSSVNIRGVKHTVILYIAFELS
jgi:hypothetical protein